MPCECELTLLLDAGIEASACARNSTTSMLGPVSAWVGDCLWTRKLPQCRTRHPGLLSQSVPSMIRLECIPGKSWGSKQTYCMIHQQTVGLCGLGICGLTVFAGCLAVWISCGDQRRRTGSSSAVVACSRRCGVQIHSLLTYLRHRRHNKQSSTTEQQIDSSCKSLDLFFVPCN